jgi:hypothetical protein
MRVQKFTIAGVGSIASELSIDETSKRCRLLSTGELKIKVPVVGV